MAKKRLGNWRTCFHGRGNQGLGAVAAWVPGEDHGFAQRPMALGYEFLSRDEFANRC